MKRIILAVTNDIVTDQRVQKVAGFLIRNNCEVHITGRVLPGSPALIKADYSVKRFRFLFHKGPLFYAAYNIRLFIYLLFHRFDVIVANDLDTLAASWLVSVLRSKPLVYDSHEYFTEVPELTGRPFVRSVWKGLERYILPRIHYSYTVCDSLASIYSRAYGIEMKVVRNLPDCSVKRHGKSIELNPEKKIIIYQGVLNTGRGLENVILSMKYLENVVFLIAGDGDITLHLKALAYEKKLSDRVIFTGRLNPSDLHVVTAKADLGISLEEHIGQNYYYALPNKLFDYIHAGIPVLVSDFPEMRKIVKGYDIGVTTLQKDHKQLAGIISEMLFNEKLRERWKQNLKKASEELCWENEEKILRDIYSEII